MRKIIAVLMMAFVVGCGAFAETVQGTMTIGGDEYIFISDDENKQRDWSGYSDKDILNVLLYGGEQSNLDATFVYYQFSEVNAAAKKYFNYALFGKDYIVFFENLGDGRMVQMMYERNKSLKDVKFNDEIKPFKDLVIKL